MQFANQLWKADTLHGPSINQADGQWKKTFLIAFLDDASRVITHAEFFYRDNTENTVQAFRSALYKRGKPARLYFDNGSNYSAKEIAQACLRLDIHLSHAPIHHTRRAQGARRVFRLRPFGLNKRRAPTLGRHPAHAGELFDDVNMNAQV